MKGIDNANFQAHGRTAGAWGIARKVSLTVTFPPCGGKVGMGGLGVSRTFLLISILVLPACILFLHISNTFSTSSP